MVFPIFRHTHMRLVLELLHNGSCAVLYFSRLEHGIPTGESLTAHKKMRFLGGSTGVIFRSPPISEKAPNLGTSSTPAASARSTASRRFSKGSLWASANGYSSGQKDTTCINPAKIVVKLVYYLFAGLLQNYKTHFSLD